MRRLLSTRTGLVAGLLLALASCGDGSPSAPGQVCSITITPGSATVGPEGGAGSITVSAPAGCAWGVTGATGWLSVTSALSGTGPGSVSYVVAANDDPAARSAALTIGGQSHTVTQPGRPAPVCSYQLSQASADFTKDAATGTFTVSAAAGCAWTASSEAGWLLITSGGQGSGDGTVAYTVAPNANIEGRTAAIRVADRTLSVYQSGDVGLCEYTVSPVDLRPCMPAGMVTAMITAPASCPWTAQPVAPWLSLATGASGTGSGAISIAFTDNYDAPRDGIVEVRWPTLTAGQNVRVAQAGCFYAVSQSGFTVSSVGGALSFDVIQQSDPILCGGATQDRCVWTAVSDSPWITITAPMPRAGDNPVPFTVAANSSPSPRMGRITVRDRVVLITQAGQ